MTLGIFIVAHNQDLILEFEKKKPDDIQVQYILVGEDPDYSKLPEELFYFNLLIPYHFVDNIEHHKNLLTFTAWHFLSLVEKTGINMPFDYFGIFEYDIDILRPLSKLASVCNKNSIISFSPMEMKSPYFIDKVPGLVESIKKVYNIDVPELIKRYSLSTYDRIWGVSTNFIINMEFLQGFVDWYSALIPEIMNYTNYSHFHERAIKIYSILNHYQTIYCTDYLKHKGLMSHNIEL